MRLWPMSVPKALCPSPLTFCHAFQGSSLTMPCLSVPTKFWAPWGQELILIEHRLFFFYHVRLGFSCDGAVHKVIKFTSLEESGAFHCLQRPHCTIPLSPFCPQISLLLCRLLRHPLQKLQPSDKRKTFLWQFWIKSRCLSYFLQVAKGLEF